MTGILKKGYIKSKKKIVTFLIFELVLIKEQIKLTLFLKKVK